MQLTGESLPALLSAQAESAAQHTALPLTSLTPRQQAALAFSDFIRDSLHWLPQAWQQLTDSPPQPDEWRHYSAWLQTQLATIEDDNALMRQLRLFRRHMLLRIGWMQLFYDSSTEQTLKQISELAETLVIAARDWLWRACCQEFGTPCNSQGEAQPLLILAMGKLGGGELNFSSDIDLILTWPENGVTRGGRRELDNAWFFTRLGQRLIKVLDQPAAEGIVWRVDMRLRPFGESGPLVLSFAALEEYYQEQGRDWERYAMVKARLLGKNDDRWHQALWQILRPFVYRRYIDFSVIQSLREMKQMIVREVRRRGLTGNIKLGAGGIREVEFIVQVFQLIRGGQQPSLQSTALLPALVAIENLNLLTPEQVAQLRAAYLFLRRLENLLQSIADTQTQTLPADELNQVRLAWAMGASGWTVLCQALEAHQAHVREIFNGLVGEDVPASGEQETHNGYGILWQDALEEDELKPLVGHLADEERKQLWQTLTGFRRDITRRTLGPRGRRVLDQLMPRLLRAVCPRVDAATTLARLTPLLLRVVTRTTYLELLIEYPDALAHLVHLCASSAMVAMQLARYPVLLDELLDAATLYQPVAAGACRDELRQYLLRIDENDEEQQLEALCQFKQIQQLRIAAADISGSLPVMKVSDRLTWLAESLIEAVVNRAWQTLVQRYGRPAHLQREEERGFAVVGYGKLGGWELGYSSDLDLVFLHDCPADVVTGGERVIDGRQFYLRLAQRILHLFSARTSSGILYEVDARLRPSGAAGLLVSTFTAFAEYQQQEAWTWEHQALVRARIVYGETALRQRFATLRRDTLCQPRDAVALQTEVRTMREKMYASLSHKYKGRWDIKTDEGGITDIEFIVQYLTLRHAAQQPQLVRWSDNVRILELLAHYGRLPAGEAEALTQAYVTLRNELHHRTLQALPGHVDPQAFSAECAAVSRSWQRWLLASDQ